MSLSEKLDSELMRLRIVTVLMLLALGFLVVMMCKIQVLNTYKYETRLDRQSIRRIRLPAPRGRIYDRNGICLADNRPSYCIAVYGEELRQPGNASNTVAKIENVIGELSSILGLEQKVTRGDIVMHLRKRRPLPFLAWRDIDDEALARLAESDADVSGTEAYLPGIGIYADPVRVYPLGNLAPHVIGYVGRTRGKCSDDDSKEDFDFYRPEMEGKRGVEGLMNRALSGKAGAYHLRVDASGFRHKDEKERGRAVTQGKDVVLTIDSRIQRLAEQVLEGRKGAVVVLNPGNGDVLALASSPVFDANKFGSGLSTKEWNSIKNDKSKPLLNRAVGEVYPPGSIFKPVVAIAALEGGKASANTTFNCPGYFALTSKARFRCWQKRGHGRVNLRKAIEQSCNPYFCQLGLLGGYDRIYHMSSALGLGRPTGIDLASETSGLLPDTVWKKRVHHDKWRSGDTCNVSIGQGALNVTPIQMAVITAAIANKGKVFRPRAVLGVFEPEDEPDWAGLLADGGRDGDLVQDMKWAASTMRVVRNGMRDVIQASSGTGKRARISDVEMAGKTGTAQYGPSRLGKLHTWMLCFAPFDDPRYAVTVIIEDGESGGRTVAPLLKELMTGVFKLEQEQLSQVAKVDM
jgi:penicillin-binding protein 2